MVWKILPCVITADLHASRHAKDRAELQEKLAEVLAEANRRFRKGILAPFRVTLGDEWQGCLADCSMAYDAAAFFRDRLSPQTIAVGIGEGTIATEISDDVRLMDGEAFHRSREAVTEAKRSRAAVVFRMRHASVDPILSSTASVLFELFWSWTPLQRERYCLVRELGTMAEVARRSGVSVAAISQSLAGAKAWLVRGCEQALSDFLRAWSQGEFLAPLVRRDQA